jgi:hypothetical protein
MSFKPLGRLKLQSAATSRSEVILRSSQSRLEVAASIGPHVGNRAQTAGRITVGDGEDFASRKLSRFAGGSHENDRERRASTV